MSFIVREHSACCSSESVAVVTAAVDCLSERRDRCTHPLAKAALEPLAAEPVEVLLPDVATFATRSPARASLPDEPSE